MNILAVFAGLDYHQERVQVCVMNREASAVSEAILRYGQPERIAIEACCGAADLAEELVVRRGLPVQLAHPGYVARLKRGPDKSDLVDARLLADLARVNYLPTVWLAPDETRQLRRLLRHRQQMVRR